MSLKDFACNLHVQKTKHFSNVWISNVFIAFVHLLQIIWRSHYRTLSFTHGCFHPSMAQLEGYSAQSHTCMSTYKCVHLCLSVSLFSATCQMCGKHHPSLSMAEPEVQTLGSRMADKERWPWRGWNYCLVGPICILVHPVSVLINQRCSNSYPVYMGFFPQGSD